MPYSKKAKYVSTAKQHASRVPPIPFAQVIRPRRIFNQPALSSIENLQAEGWKFWLLRQLRCSDAEYWPLCVQITSEFNQHPIVYSDAILCRFER